MFDSMKSSSCPSCPPSSSPSSCPSCSPAPAALPGGEDFLRTLADCTDLGHSKRNQAFVRQVSLLLQAPGKAGAEVPAVPGAGGAPWADLVSLYRFAGNEEIDLARLREARRRFVLQPLEAGREILAVHDPTTLNFAGQDSKTDRRRIGNDKGKGYEYVPVLAVDPASGDFLGVLHDTVINNAGPDDAGEMDYDYDPLFAGFSEADQKRLRENHRHQMAVHVRGLAPHLRQVRVVHVADREFDDVFLVLAALDSDSELIVRATGLRNVQVPEAPWIPPEARTQKQWGHAAPEGWACVNLPLLLPAIACEPYKEIALDAKGRVASQPAAAARIARLEIGGCRVRLYRAARRNKQYFLPPRAVEVHLVLVREIDPPADASPLCWTLFTTLPAATLAQRIRVASFYEKRWGVEVFFRLLKSGYGIERSRLRDAAKTGRLLVVLTIAALVVIRLKTAMGLGPGGKLDDETYQKAKQAVKNPEAPEVTPEWKLFGLVLRYGGWLGRRNDPVGPKILMRGILMTLAVLEAIEYHRKLLETVLENKPILRRIFCV